MEKWLPPWWLSGWGVIAGSWRVLGSYNSHTMLCLQTMTFSRIYLSGKVFLFIIICKNKLATEPFCRH